MDTTRFIKRNLTLAYVISLVVAVIMAAASVAGVLDTNRVYPGVEAKLLPLYVGQDALNLIVGLPLLLGSMWLARRGALIGLLLWPGALFYVLYDYGYYALGAPFTALFLPYLALIALSTYAMIGVVVSVDSAAVRDRLASTVPPRLVGGSLVAVALLFMALWTAITVSTLTSGAPVSRIVHDVLIMDLTVQLPALLVAGILMWRREPFAYVVSAGLLLQAAAYLIGLAIITVVQEVVTNAPFDPTGVVPGIVVGIIFLALLVTFVRGAGERSSSLTAKVAGTASART